MDSVLDRLSALETIWRVTTTSNISAFEEFDVFTCKKEETTRINRVIEELIEEANTEQRRLLTESTEFYVRIEDEIKEIGIASVLPQPPNQNQNLPIQLNNLKSLHNELLEIKTEISSKIDRIYQESLHLYRAELEVNDSGSMDPLSSWMICELFQNDLENNHCDTSHSSFTSAAVAHLDAAINKMDPFQPSLLGSLERLESAHSILKGRLELFRVEYEQLWTELSGLFHKLNSFEQQEYEDEDFTLVMNCIKQQCAPSNFEISRSCLKRVLSAWKRIEKERSESISGSILLIGRLWTLLETRQEEKFPLNPQDLSLSNMSLLQNERTRLINFQQEKFKELYDNQQQELFKLMTALGWSEQKQLALLSNCVPYTADGLQFLSIQLAALQPKLDLSLTLIASISARHALIDKMREFEKSASDPARLFRSSFQLLQEEKFRKTALPSLLNLEGQLRAQLSEYSAKFNEEFNLADSTASYSSVLEEEITNRFVSSGIFGFDQSKQRKDRQQQQQQQQQQTPRYLVESSNTTANSNNNNISRKNAPNLIPQRRKLDK